jgi:hypothetical protein
MRSSSDRGQLEPLAALAAVFAIGVGLSLYVGALDSILPLLTPDHSTAPTAADRLVAEGSSFGSVTTPIEEAATTARPMGYELNATLRTSESSWIAGPGVPRSAECANRRVSVRVAPARVRSGLLEVCVWPAR